MNSSLMDRLYAYLGTFDRGVGPHGLTLQKVQGRAANFYEEDGQLYFSIERHEPLGVGHISGRAMHSMLTCRTKYQYANLPVENIEEVEVAVVGCDLDLTGELLEKLDEERVTILRYEDSFSLSLFDAGEILHADSKEELLNQYKQLWRDEISRLREQFTDNLEDKIRLFPDLKQYAEEYLKDNSVEEIYSELIGTIEDNFNEASEEEVLD